LRGLNAMGQLRGFGAGLGEGAGILVLERGEHARKRHAQILAGVGEVRSIGMLDPGAREQGFDRLLPEPGRPDLIGLSGTAGMDQPLLDHLPETPRLDTARLLGRSLAMGGLAMAALVMTLEPGNTGLHLAASPEGPYYAIDLYGGDPVQS